MVEELFPIAESFLKNHAFLHEIFFDDNLDLVLKDKF